MKEILIILLIILGIVGISTLIVWLPNKSVYDFDNYKTFCVEKKPFGFVDYKKTCYRIK